MISINIMLEKGLQVIEEEMCLQKKFSQKAE